MRGKQARLTKRSVKAAERSGESMNNDVVLEGIGTPDEMEARLINELKRRDWFTHAVVRAVRFELTPRGEEPGDYRIRIPAPI